MQTRARGHWNPLTGPRGWAEARGGTLGPRPPRGNGPVGSWGTRACARLTNEAFVYWSVGSNQASGCSVPAQKTNFPPPLTERTRVCLRLRVLSAFYCASGSFEFLFSDTAAQHAPAARVWSLWLQPYRNRLNRHSFLWRRSLEHPLNKRFPVIAVTKYSAHMLSTGFITSRPNAVPLICSSSAPFL